MAGRGAVPVRRRPAVLPLSGGDVERVPGAVEDGLDLFLVGSLGRGGSGGVAVHPHGAVEAGVGAAGAGLLAVGLHYAAEVGGLVGDVLEIGLEELSEDGQGAVDGELLEGVERAVV